MDAVTSLIAGWRVLRDLTDLPQRMWGPSVLIAPLLWCAARVVVCVVAGADFRRSLRALPPDIRRWESSALGRRFRIVRGGAGTTEPPSGSGDRPSPAETYSDSPEAFVRRYQASLVAWAERLARVVGDPDDLYEDALVTLLERWDQLSGRNDDKKLGYLYRTMANDVRDLGRSRSRFPRFASRLMAGSRATSPSAEDEQAHGRRARLARAELERILAVMPPARAAAMRLRLAGLSNHEIAETMRTTPASVASHLHRAHRDIARLVRPELRGELLDDKPFDDEPVDEPVDEPGRRVPPSRGRAERRAHTDPRTTGDDEEGRR